MAERSILLARLQGHSSLNPAAQSRRSLRSVLSCQSPYVALDVFEWDFGNCCLAQYLQVSTRFPPVRHKPTMLLSPAADARDLAEIQSPCAEIGMVGLLTEVEVVGLLAGGPAAPARAG